MILGLVGETNVNRPAPETAFLKVQPLLDRADVLFGHMESPVIDKPSTNDDMPDLPYKKGWVFSTPDNVKAWKVAGFDAVGVASNVSGSVESTLRTIEELDNQGIAHAGIGKNIKDAHAPAIITKNGVSIGFLSYTSVFYPHWVPALENRPGAATVQAHMSIIPSWRTEEMPGAMPSVKTWLDEAEKAAMIEDVKALKQKADIVVLSCHWGVTDGENAQEYQIELAHAAMDAGADVIIGHHPHRPQGIEIYNGKPIFYSMGNFAFDWWLVRNWLKEGIFGCVTFEDKKIKKISFVPVRREDDSNDVAQVACDSEAGIAIFQTVERLSKPFGTKLTVEGDEIVLTV